MLNVFSDETGLVFGLFVAGPLDYHVVNLLQVVPEADIRVELNAELFAVYERVLVVRIGEGEHKRVVAAVVVGVCVGVGEADFGEGLDENARLVVLGEVPVVEVALLGVVDHLDGLVDGPGGNDRVQLVLVVVVEGVREVD